MKMKQTIKNIIEKLTWKRIIWASICIVCILAAIILNISRVNMVKKLEDQTVISRWTDNNDWSQISCYFSNKEDVKPDRIMQIRYMVEQKLKGASIDVTSENPSARLIVDCYSAIGEVSASYGKNTFSGTAYGVGAAFFLFHPLPLVYANYFSETDLMDDYVLIDEEIAWKLFGSSNVVGKYITIKNIPHKIVGVYERVKDSMNEKAGNAKPTMYLSYNSLNKYGTNRGIKTYEIILQNPVSGFAKKNVAEVLAMDEYSVSIVENSTRYQLPSLWKILRSFPTRSMSMHGIIYPFWENIARGYEDVAVILLKIEFACLIIPILTFIIVCIWLRKIVKEKIRKRKDGKNY